MTSKNTKKNTELPGLVMLGLALLLIPTGVLAHNAGFFAGGMLLGMPGLLIYLIGKLEAKPD